ncbi:MAG: hypothetical protein AAGI01_04580 [Myxococcota bacterium]
MPKKKPRTNRREPRHPELHQAVIDAWASMPIPDARDLFEFEDIDTESIKAYFGNRAFDQVNRDDPQACGEMPFIWFNHATAHYYLASYLLDELGSYPICGDIPTIQLFDQLANDRFARYLQTHASPAQLDCIAGCIDVFLKECGAADDIDFWEQLEAARRLFRSND